MRTEQVTIFKFNELSENAKESARQWWREGDLDSEWYECTIDDSISALEMVGFYNVKIYFSGFCSQGDGACFTGNYEYQKGALKAVKNEFPQWEALHTLTEQLQLINRRYFYQLAFKLEHSGRCSHGNSVTVDYIERLDGFEINNEVELFEELLGTVREFMQEIYIMLKREYDYLTSDEQVDEAITINEYEFDENGSIV